MEKCIGIRYFCVSTNVCVCDIRITYTRMGGSWVCIWWLSTDSAELAEPGFCSKHLERARAARSVSQFQDAPGGQTGRFPGRHTGPRRDASARLEARHGLSCGMPEEPGMHPSASAGRLSQTLGASQLPWRISLSDCPLASCRQSKVSVRIAPAPL